MFFKNATLFRISPTLLKGITEATKQGDEQGAEIRPSLLAEALAEFPLKPIGPLELDTLGFVPPFGSENDSLTQTIGNHVLVALGGEHKIIPPSSVNALVAKKCADLEAKDGRRPSGRARKRIKEEIVMDLLPKALTKPSRTSAILNIEHGYIAVDTPSRKVAEKVVSAIRIALGSFPALTINAEVSPRAVLTGWVSGDSMPNNLSLGDEVELRDPVDGGAVVKCKNQYLQCEEIGKHLESGKQVTKLALSLGDHVLFAFDESLIVRKFKLLDGALDSLESVDRDDLPAELQARFALMGSELEQVFITVESAFKLTKAED